MIIRELVLRGFLGLSFCVIGFLFTRVARADMPSVVEEEFAGPSLDSSWSIAMINVPTSVWHYEFTDSEFTDSKLKVVGIDTVTSIPDRFTNDGGYINGEWTWGEVILSKTFKPLGDFDIEFNFEWESFQHEMSSEERQALPNYDGYKDQEQALKGVYLRLLSIPSPTTHELRINPYGKERQDRRHVIVQAGHLDSYIYGFPTPINSVNTDNGWQQKWFLIDSYDGFSDTEHIKITRRGNHIIIDRGGYVEMEDGSELYAGEGYNSQPITRVELVFGAARVLDGPDYVPSHFGRILVDAIKIQGKAPEKLLRN